MKKNESSLDPQVVVGSMSLYSQGDGTENELENEPGTSIVNDEESQQGQLGAGEPVVIVWGERLATFANDEELRVGISSDDPTQFDGAITKAGGAFPIRAFGYRMHFSQAIEQTWQRCWQLEHIDMGYQIVAVNPKMLSSDVAQLCQIIEALSRRLGQLERAGL